ncbi:MAG TPA: carboxypeptidase M32, partial [Roseovarius sp.]|nr:carboxypeptidase M32 [Roseovarius sp.]
MSAYDELMAFTRETEALAQVAGLLSWDQETMMPRGAAAQRSEATGAMESVLHARRTDPRLAEWLASAEAPDEGGAAQLRLLRHDYERAVRVPGELATALAR